MLEILCDNTASPGSHDHDFPGRKHIFRSLFDHLHVHLHTSLLQRGVFYRENLTAYFRGTVLGRQTGIIKLRRGHALQRGIDLILLKAHIADAFTETNNRRIADAYLFRQLQQCAVQCLFEIFQKVVGDFSLRLLSVLPLQLFDQPLLTSLFIVHGLPTSFSLYSDVFSIILIKKQFFYNPFISPNSYISSRLTIPLSFLRI